MNTEEKREMIFNIISDSILDMLVYDRKDDEYCPREFIETAVKDGTITINEMVEKFQEGLQQSI